MRKSIDGLCAIIMKNFVSAQFWGGYKKEILASTPRHQESKHFTPFIYTTPEHVRSKEQDFRILRLTYPCLDDVQTGTSDNRINLGYRFQPFGPMSRKSTRDYEEKSVNKIFYDNDRRKTGMKSAFRLCFIYNSYKIACQERAGNPPVFLTFFIIPVSVPHT